MSDPDALTTVPMALPAAAEPSDFIAAISAYAARSAHALQVFGSEGT